MTKQRKPKYNWEAIEADYRAGVLSIRAVAAKHGMDEAYLRREAKKRKWERDLENGVRERTREIVVRAISPQDKPADKERDEQIIDDAARTQIGVILEHRKDIREARDLVRDLLSELRGQTHNAEALEELIEYAFSLPTPSDAMTRFALKKALSLSNRASTMDRLASSVDRMVRLERQAFGLEEKPVNLGDDPVRKQQGENLIEGYTDEQRAKALLNLIERSTRTKATAAAAMKAAKKQAKEGTTRH